MTIRLRNLEPSTRVLRSAYSRSRVRSKTKVSATNNRKISAETAAKMSVSSLVSGCRKVNLKVACAKITAKRKKVQMESATIAGVLFRFFGGRVGGVNGNINSPRPAAPESWIRDYAGRFKLPAGDLIISAGRVGPRGD